MKKSILIFSLLACLSTALRAEDINKSKFNSPACRSFNTGGCCKKQTCAASPISKSGIIEHAGCYCLTKDIKGTIVIAADNVTLDLNCHLVDGNGAVAAIAVNNQQDVTIKNGAVTNTGSLGVSATDCTGLTLEDLQIYNSNNALAMTRCASSQVNGLRAYDNFNTAGALILLDDCDSVQLSNVHAEYNVKALSNVIDFDDPEMGVLALFNSGNVTLTNCSTNNNTQTNDNNTFAPFLVEFCSNVQVVNLQSNNNSHLVDNAMGSSIIYILSSTSVVLDGFQANGNYAQSTDAYFAGVDVYGSVRTVVKNGQINDNVLGLTVPDGSLVALNGLILSFLTSINDTFVSNCQISGNRVLDGGANRTDTDGFGEVRGITVFGLSNVPNRECRAIIENCQVNDNIMETSGDFQSASGIILPAAADVTIRNCSFDDNSGGSRAVGMALFALGSFGPFPCRNIRVLNCTANNISSRDLAVGIFVGTGFTLRSGAVSAPSENCAIIGCQTNRNRAAISGNGIVLMSATGCSFIDNEMDNNSHNGLFAGTIDSVFGPNPENTNNCIINCSAKENFGNGFELSAIGANNNFLLEDNVALANGGVGFLHAPAALTSSYLGNFSHANSLNYSINGGAIQIFSLDNMGLFAPVTGDALRFSNLVNIDRL